ncbi:cfem domain-containing protein [Apiospora kogelbergensis]|uniref:Cfem domain-containing protein n=1 Tax=Apiospora kogelbergensis TaxID=1337665 RepID=A0AAW0Q4X7_9PEZI
MRLEAFALAATAFLAGCVQAQSASAPTEASNHTAAASAEAAAGAAAMKMALQMFPKCALGCLAEVIPKSPCHTTDVKCLCTNKPLNAELGVCILGGCTKYEALMSKNASMTMCMPGVPLRDETQKPLLIGVVGGVIAVVVCAMRMMSGLPAGGRKLGWDDWTILMALALSMPPTVFSVLLSNNGLGRDMWTLPMQNIENVLFLYYLGEIFYFAALAVNKISILIFILRVFPDQSFRRIVYGVIGLTAAYGISFVVATMLQCQPLNYSWKQIDSTIQGKCNNIHLQGWMSAILNIVVDLIILVLPLKQLYALQTNLKKKIMIMVMFSLGIFVTIVSAIRLRSLIVFAASQNITWDYNEAAYWSTIEMHVGIVCACLPALRALFVAMGAKALGSSKGNSKGSSGYSTGHSGRSGAPRSGTFGSRSAGGDGEKLAAQGVPRHGDESDFVPLVEINSRSKTPVGVAISGNDSFESPYERQKRDGY